MALAHNPRIVTDGLVLCLDAANPKSYSGSGTAWGDISGNGNNGTLVNGVGYTTDNKGAMVFDGVDDSSSISGLNFVGFTGLTINIWYFSNINASTALTRASSVSNGFILHYRGAGFYLVSNTGAVSNYLGWQTTLPFNEWLMLSATWNGSTMKLYVNGIKQPNERSFSGTLATINTILLGYNFNTTQPWTNGKISSFTLYNKELTPEEIQQNFQATRGRYGI